MKREVFSFAEKAWVLLGLEVEPLEFYSFSGQTYANDIYFLSFEIASIILMYYFHFPTLFLFYEEFIKPNVRSRLSITVLAKF